MALNIQNPSIFAHTQIMRNPELDTRRDLAHPEVRTKIHIRSLQVKTELLESILSSTRDAT